MKYMVVYKHPRNGALRAADNGKFYVNRLTAVRHLHICEMKKNGLIYEVMAIPEVFADSLHHVMMFLRMNEEEREYFKKEFSENA